MGREEMFLSSQAPPRSFTCAIFRAVCDSCSSFFAPKPHRNASSATQARRHILHYTVEPLYNPTMETEESGLCGGVLNKSQCVDFFCPPGRQKVAVVDQRGGR